MPCCRCTYLIGTPWVYCYVRTHAFRNAFEEFFVGFNDMRKRPSHATAMSKELTPVHTKQGRKSRWSGGSANSKSSPFTTCLQFVQDYFQIFVFMVFASIALYYAGSFFKVKSYTFHTLILYQHENHHNMDRSDSFLHTSHNQVSGGKSRR